MPSAANRTTWARCTKRCGWLLAFAQDCRVTRSSGDKATKGARLLMGKIIRERVKYVKLFMTHYTSLRGCEEFCTCAEKRRAPLAGVYASGAESCCSSRKL